MIQDLLHLSTKRKAMLQSAKRDYQKNLIDKITPKGQQFFSGNIKQMSKLHTADLYTRVLELQHQLDAQRGKIKKIEKNHKAMRKHFKTIDLLDEIMEIIEVFKHENSSASIRIQSYLFRDRDIDLISAIRFIRALKELTLNTEQLMEELA